MFIYLEHDLIGVSMIVLPYILLFLLGVSELSDAFDGYVARRMHQVTDLGKILDPMADSIYRISVFLPLGRNLRSIYRFFLSLSFCTGTL